MNNCDYKYKFSVIIPIYNVEKYLEETILSVIKQTIGFQKNIQIILVNDGSTDNSEKICMKYENEYPENIKYIYQENKGVSSARNKGMEFIEGEYVNFLDSDDIWDLDVFEKVYDFFEINKNNIDVVACRQKFFEDKEGYHQLDYKFKNNHIVDIVCDYEEIQLSMASAFIKNTVINRYRYDTRLKYLEDATLMGQILMEKSKYGIISDAIYNYRKRKKKTSALQNRDIKKELYFDISNIEYGYKVLIEKSMKNYGKVLQYYQYQIMYDIQWRLKIDISKYLDEKERNLYLEKINEILQYIDDDVIMKQKHLWKEYKVLALCLKYQKDVRNEFYYKNDRIYFNDLKILNIKNNSLLRIEKIKKKLLSKNVIIEGQINCLLLDKDYKIYAKLSNEQKKYISNYKIINNRESIKGNLNNCKRFVLEIPIISEKFELKIMIAYKCSNQRRLNLVFNSLSNLENEDEKYIYAKRNIIITSINNKMQIKKANKKEMQFAKKQCVKLIEKNNKIEKCKIN